MSEEVYVINTGLEFHEKLKEVLEGFAAAIERIEHINDDVIHQPIIIPKNIPPFHPKIFRVRKQIPVVRKINFVRLNRSSKDRRINKWKNHKRECFRKAI